VSAQWSSYSDLCALYHLEQLRWWTACSVGVNDDDEVLSIVAPVELGLLDGHVLRRRQLCKRKRQHGG
jgi:hypothetical protein